MRNLSQRARSFPSELFSVPGRPKATCAFNHFVNSRDVKRSWVAHTLHLFLGLALAAAASADPLIFFANSGQSLRGLEVATDVALGDIDGDGDLDAVVANSGGPSQVWVNQGGVQNGVPGSFLDSRQLIATGSSQAVELADLDSDGDLDAFFVESNPLEGGCQIWINDGGFQGGTPGFFVSNGQKIGASLGRSVALGDLNADAALDAVVAMFGLPGYPDDVWLNDGSGQFRNSGQALGNDASVDLMLGDLDGDNDLDAFVLHFEGSRIWWNQGGRQRGSPGTFATDETGIGAGQTYGGTLGDIDRDGDLDVIVAKLFTSELWYNQGGLQGGTQGQFALSQDPLPRATDVALGDLDGDGDLDAVFGVSSGALPRLVYQNFGSSLESAFVLGSGPVNAIKLGDLDGDGDVDAFILGIRAPHEIWINTTEPAIDEPNFQSTPSPGEFVDFGTFYEKGASKFRRVFLANTGLRDLEVSSIYLTNSGGGFTYQFEQGGNINPTLPLRLRYGNLSDLVTILITATPTVDTDSGATLVVVSNDPDAPIATYSFAYGADLRPQTLSIEESILSLFRAVGRPNIGVASPAPSPNIQIVHLQLATDEPHSVTTPLPEFLGGGSLVLNSFTGSVTVALSRIHTDRNRMAISVERGRFTAPSALLPNGSETGLNTLTFGPATQSEGLLDLTTGEYSASATARIVNNLYPNGIPVSGTYRGTYDSESGRITLVSQSTDAWPIQVELDHTWSGNSLLLTWTQGVLESIADPKGTWATVPNARSPHTVDTSLQKQQFFRLRIGAGP